MKTKNYFSALEHHSKKSNILIGRFQQSTNDGLGQFKWGKNTLSISPDNKGISRLMIHPERIAISTKAFQGNRTNVFRGVIKQINKRGKKVNITVEVGRSCLSVRMEFGLFQKLGLIRYQPVYVRLAAEDLSTPNDPDLFELKSAI